jgi:hypothetical protein
MDWYRSVTLLRQSDSLPEDVRIFPRSWPRSGHTVSERAALAATSQDSNPTVLSLVSSDGAAVPYDHILPSRRLRAFNAGTKGCNNRANSKLVGRNGVSAESNKACHTNQLTWVAGTEHQPAHLKEVGSGDQNCLAR